VNDRLVFEATGRRKTSTARVRIIMPGTGKIEVNKRNISSYFMRETLVMIVEQPLKITEMLGTCDILITTKGGGLLGQAGAARLGVARALLKKDETLRKTLKAAGFLIRDPRMVERKKYGMAGARKRYQFSKR